MIPETLATTNIYENHVNRPKFIAFCYERCSGAGSANPLIAVNSQQFQILQNLFIFLLSYHQATNPWQNQHTAR
jgi:hypothetical protein